jgi:hypothetical protein
MTNRRLTSLLLACALLGPASSYAPGADEPKKDDAQTKQKAEDAKKSEGSKNDEKKDSKKDESKKSDAAPGGAPGVVSDEVLKAAAAAGPTTQPTVATGDDRKPHKKPKDGEVYALSIQELGNFEFDQEKGGNIPKDVKALAGATVRLTGYMIPLDQADKIKQFVLVPDLFACCFGQPPQVQHSIIAACPAGKAVSYFPEQIVIEGKLNVEEKKDDGFIVSIFDVNVTSVKPAPK